MKVKVRFETWGNEKRWRWYINVSRVHSVYGTSAGSKEAARGRWLRFARRMGIPPDKYEIVEE